MKKILALILALLLALSLCACGGGSGSSIVDSAQQQQQQSTDSKPLATDPPKETEAPAVEDTVVGYYKATSILGDDGNGGTFDMVALLEAFGMKMFLVLNEDGTGYLDSAGEQSELRWEGNHLIVTNDEGEEERPEFVYADGVITFEEDDTKMTFTKLTAEELADYLENGSGSGFSWGDDELLPEGDPSTGPVSGTVNGCDVTVLGAEALKDDDGNPLFRVYYEFTNNTDDFTMAYRELYFEAQQDGEACEWGYTFDDAVPEDDYDGLALLPGKTIRCTDLYQYDPDGGTICFHISDFWDEDNIYYYIDPANPIGAPTQPFDFGTDTSVPAALKALPMESDALLIWNYEQTVGYSDEPLIRIYTEFSNLGEEATSFYMGHSVYAFQDGYGLESGYAKDDVEEDDNRYTEIDPEDWIDVANCFVLRSESPVLFVIVDDNTDERVGIVIEDINSTIGKTYAISSVGGISMDQYAAYTGTTVEEARRMMVLTLFPDGSAIYSSYDDSYQILWRLDGETLVLYAEDETESILDATLVDNTITIVSEGTEIILTLVE